MRPYLSSTRRYKSKLPHPFRRTTMRRRWQLWARNLTMTAAAGVVLFAGDRLSAQMAPPAQTPPPTQTPRSGVPLGMQGFEVKEDETTPRLYNGANGTILRLWQRVADRQAGGGTVFVAAAEGANAWRAPFEVRSPEPGISARDPELAVGSSGQLALIYRWWVDKPRSKQIRL